MAQRHSDVYKTGLQHTPIHSQLCSETRQDLQKSNVMSTAVNTEILHNLLILEKNYVVWVYFVIIFVILRGDLCICCFKFSLLLFVVTEFVVWILFFFLFFLLHNMSKSTLFLRVYLPIYLHYWSFFFFLFFPHLCNLMHIQYTLDSTN